jgi:hypothetical protein
MINGPSNVVSETVDFPGRQAGYRERVTVRRRREWEGLRFRKNWTASPRRRAVQTVFVCAGALLLMAAALYFSLSLQNAGPGESVRGVVTGARGAA